MGRNVVHQIANPRNLRIGTEPLVIGPREIPRAILAAFLQTRLQHGPHRTPQILRGPGVIQQASVRQVDVKKVVTALVPCLHRGDSQFPFGVFHQDQVNLVRADFLRRPVDSDIDRDLFVPSAADEREAFLEHAHTIAPQGALFYLSPLDTGKGEQIPAHVIKRLNGMAVQGIDLIKDFPQRKDRIGVGFRRPILERINRHGVVQFGDDKKLPVRRHPIPANPNKVIHHTQIRVGDLG